MGISDQEKEFTIELAAKLMAGGIEVEDTNKLFEDELKCLKKRLLDAYAIAVISYQKMFESDDSTTYQEQNSAGAIKNIKMQACERITKLDLKWCTMYEWLKSSSATIEHQLFEREELRRWVNENNISTKYQFADAPTLESNATVNVTKLTEYSWKEEARKQARAIIEHKGSKGFHPSLQLIGDEIAKDWRTRNKFGPKGTPLSSAYIKRHALQSQGITIDRSRLIQTPKSRGK